MTDLTAHPEFPEVGDPDFNDLAYAWAIFMAGTGRTELNALNTALNALAASMASIAAGTATSIPYTFSTTTTDADPGAGYLRLDNATQNTATTIRADLLGSDGSTWTSVLDTFDDSTSTIKGFVMLQKVSDGTKWLYCSVSSLASPSGYKNITVVPVAGSAASPFSNGDALVLKFTRNGDKGDTGLDGWPIIAAGGTVDAITADYTPNITLADMTKACFVSSGANTSATPTFTPDGLTTHTITARGGAALVAGDIGPAGAVMMVEYNLANTRWEPLNPMGWAVRGANTFTGVQTIAATGAQNLPRVTVASHATTADIWTAGHQIDWTGTATTTAFPAAPQAGAERVLVCAAACSFTAGANMLIDGVASAATVTCAANDTVTVRAVTTTQFKLSRVKYDGTAQVAPGPTRSARTSNTILGTADTGTFIDITSGTFTQTFTAVATLGNGWFCYLRNSGTGDITLDPNSTETIDGLTSYVMYPGECRLIMCTGAALVSTVLTPFSRAITTTLNPFTTPPGYSMFGGLLWGGGGAGGKSGALAVKVGGGGGGACVPFLLTAAQMGASQVITIGAGGTAASSANNGGVGGTSTIGSLVSAYGGGGGGGNAADRGGGGGGGSQSAGTTGGAGDNALGGLPARQTFNIIALPSTGFAGGFGAGSEQDQSNADWGGGGGGNGGATRNAGNAIYGGGGGDGVTAANAVNTPGTSKFAGNGGAASSASSGTAGSQPAGGGGATQTGATSGAGGAGQCNIWGVV